MNGRVYMYVFNFIIHASYSLLGIDLKATIAKVKPFLLNTCRCHVAVNGAFVLIIQAGNKGKKYT